MLGWLKALIDGVARDLFGALDAAVPAPPGELQSACGAIQSAASEMGAWSWLVPWDAVGPAVGIVVSAVVASVVIRVMRIGASVLTGGGGA